MTLCTFHNSLSWSSPKAFFAQMAIQLCIEVPNLNNMSLLLSRNEIRTCQTYLDIFWGSATRSRRASSQLRLDYRQGMLSTPNVAFSNRRETSELFDPFLAGVALPAAIRKIQPVDLISVIPAEFTFKRIT